jgi:hypothetical protein
MSGAAQGDANTTKAIVSDSKDDSQPLAPQKQAAQLEEDDEFEDFPVEGASTPALALFSNMDMTLIIAPNRLACRGGTWRIWRWSRNHASVGGELG